MNDASDSSRQPRLNILMTEGSSISARQMLYDLGPQHTIDILDPSLLGQCRASRFVRRWYRCPSFTADPCGFLSCLGDRLRAGRYDVLLPPHDEVYLLSRVRDVLAKRVALAIPEFDLVAALQSKIQFVAIAKELQLPQPESHIVTDERELNQWTDFPRYAKLDYGTAGQAVRLVHNRQDLQMAIDSFKQHGWWTSGAPVLLQRPATGIQGFVRGVYRRGQMLGIHDGVLRMRGVGGAAVARVSVEHPLVTQHMRRLGERLRWHGVLFAEYFYDETTATPQYIEANPRIGDCANASFSGANLVQQWIDVALDREVTPSGPAVSGVRSHSSMLILMSQALNGANRRLLWNELREQRRGGNIYADSRDELTRPADDWLSVVPFAWVASRLLIHPAAVHGLVRRTVANYALTAEAAQRIGDLPLERLKACLGE